MGVLGESARPPHAHGAREEASEAPLCDGERLSSTTDPARTAAAMGDQEVGGRFWTRTGAGPKQDR